MMVPTIVRRHDRGWSAGRGGAGRCDLISVPRGVHRLRVRPALQQKDRIVGSRAVRPPGRAT